MKRALEFLDYPITERILDEPQEARFIDQTFCFCEECQHGQLMNAPDKSVLYGDDYNFRSTVSSYGASKNNDILVDLVPDKHYKRIVEIGCNDGDLIKKICHKCDDAYGVDPVTEARVEDNIVFVRNFIENVHIDLDDTLVVSNQVIEHLENPHSLFKRLSHLATDTTEFIFGFPNFNILHNNKRYDQIFTHHLQYFTVHSTIELLKRNGFKLTGIHFNEDYWGTQFISFKLGEPTTDCIYDKITTWDIIQHYDEFVLRMKYAEDFLLNNKAYVYGANYQLPILNYYMDIDSFALGVIDDDTTKIGKYLPDVRHPICSLDDINISDSNFLITAINFTRPITKKLIEGNANKIYSIFGEV